MTVRPLEDRDIPALERMAEASGFPYCDPRGTLTEAALAVVDDQDQVIMACAAKRLVELYLWVGAGMTPAQKLRAIHFLHEEMAAALKHLGYSSCEVFLPPELERPFGRRLMKTFGWIQNWKSFCRSF